MPQAAEDVHRKAKDGLHPEQMGRAKFSRTRAYGHQVRFIAVQLAEIPCVRTQPSVQPTNTNSISHGPSKSPAAASRGHTPYALGRWPMAGL